VGGLDLEEDSAAVEGVDGEPADGGEEDAEDHRSYGRVGDGVEDFEVEPAEEGDVGLRVDEVQCSGKEFGEDVGRDGVGAEDKEDFVAAESLGVDVATAGGGLAGAVDVDEVDGEAQKEQAPTGSVKDVGAGPELLVDGEGEVPEAAGDQAGAGGEGYASGFLDDAASGSQPYAGEDTNKRGRKGGQGAEQAFGVAGALVEVRGGEYLAVKPGGEVRVLVEEWDLVGGDAVAGDRDEAHEDPIAEETGDGEDELVLPRRAVEIEDGHDEIADGDARKDSVKAHGVEMEEGEAVDEQAEEKEGDGSANGVEEKRGFAVAFGETRLRGEDGGDADEEEEGGEDEVGGGEAVPVGVLHGPVGVVASTVVVDHDHEADGEAAEDVDREPAVLLGDGGGAFDGGKGGFSHGAFVMTMLYQGEARAYLRSNGERRSRSLRDDSQKSKSKKQNTGVSPLRFASVEMTATEGAMRSR